MADQVYKPRRQNPAKAQMARVGNYVAPVDTTGMDESMKQTMGIGVKPKPKPKKKSFMDNLKSMIGMK